MALLGASAVSLAAPRKRPAPQLSSSQTRIRLQGLVRKVGNAPNADTRRRLGVFVADKVREARASRLISRGVANRLMEELEADPSP